MTGILLPEEVTTGEMTIDDPTAETGTGIGTMTGAVNGKSLLACATHTTDVPEVRGTKSPLDDETMTDTSASDQPGTRTHH
jgi:hypothetical protein